MPSAIRRVNSSAIRLYSVMGIGRRKDRAAAILSAGTHREAREHWIRTRLTMCRSPCLNVRTFNLIWTTEMPVSVLESSLFKDMFGSAAMRAVFDDAATVRRYVEVEVALARVQAELGIIPADAARAIAE